jgi:hypothetical protein
MLELMSGIATTHGSFEKLPCPQVFVCRTDLCFPDQALIVPINKDFSSNNLLDKVIRYILFE